MKKYLSIARLALLVLFTTFQFFMSISHATSLSSVDLISGSGDGLLTLDSLTGRQWLDMTETALRTYDDVAGELGVGGDFEGFTIATFSDVLELYQNAGIPNIGYYNAYHEQEPLSENYDSVMALQLLMGNLIYQHQNLDYTHLGFHGYVYSSDPLLVYRTFLDAYDFDPTYIENHSHFVYMQMGLAEIPDGTYPYTPVSRNLRSSETGTWLYRVDPAPAPVPEPSTWLLLGTGLAGLAVYRRRRK